MSKFGIVFIINGGKCGIPRTDLKYMKRVAIIRKSSYLIKYLRVREKQEIYERKRKKKYLRVREMDRRRERNKLYEKKRQKLK